ncbi:Rieske (2Fe-2S) protein [Cellulomonas alba]|uniref:Cytochrome bc1 complex Rieske iron-sulfur subunit n=1 Tax=Cellulomonas alba TaxID=3053467 RepID=A0ABT7SFM4_9CELL|nr:Rieske (2Fe-2S) protein [Cellulomonas alba]MDM7854982.1 Rieske (2Fe-2S) protein [Cellulomonas alba]
MAGVGAEDGREGVERRAVVEVAAVAVVAGVAGYVGFRVAAPTPGGGTYGITGGEPKPPAATTGAGGAALAPLADVPDGGGVVLADQRVVLTRTGSQVHGFSAVCTHLGCLVRDVHDGEIRCPCHGSRFDATTGAVLQGPATRPLASVPVAVEDGEVVRT